MIMGSLLLTKIEQARDFPTRRDGTMRKRVAFGTERAVQLNPLLSLVEDWMHAPGGYVEHMHKGFETVTLVFAGQVSCTDAQGARVLLEAGDVQWINTGRGVMHAEMAEGDGEAHLVQLWLNLPADQKRVEPRGVRIPCAAVPLVERPGARVRVIAGDFEGERGVARAGCGARVLDVHLEAGASLELPIASGQLGVVYALRGSFSAGAQAVQAGDVLHFSSKVSDELALVASEPAHFVLLDAPPLAEPVIVNGPFIMNTATEIQQAYADFRAGTFAAPPGETFSSL